MANRQPTTLKPHKGAFFIPPLLIVGFFSIILLLPLFIILKDSGAFGSGIFNILGIVLFAIFAITYWLTAIKYRKTSYILDRDRIIYKTGTIFSDREIELPIRNITHLQLRLPWVSHFLFKTGDIRVESAGSSATEGEIFAISNSREIYDELQEMMKQNGFSMQKKELKEELKPSPLAVIFETLKFVGSAIFVAFIIVSDLATNKEGEIREFDDNFIDIATVVGFVILGIILVFAIFRYLDLKKRVYKVYNDAVEYSEGFLTKNYSLIPFENLTDSLSTQSFIDQIFGLYDIELSCPGAKKEIKFKNIIEGDELAKSVGKLIREFNNTKKKIENPAKKSKNLRVQEFSNFDKSYTAEFRMNKLRAFAFPLFVLIFAGILATFSPALMSIAIFAGISAITILIQVLSTTYAVSRESIDYHYKFLSAKNISFVNEKITSVVLRESWVDKIFGTCQIHFGSIGSAEKIKFLHLKKTEDLYKNILAKFGFNAKNPEFELEPEFTVGNFAKSSFFVPIWFLAVALITLIMALGGESGFAMSLILQVNLAFLLVVVLPIFIYMKFYYKKSRIFFYNDYLSVKKGLLVQLHAYANFANIKNITTVKYPLTGAGMVKFDVAGESISNHNMSQEERLLKNVTFGSSSTKVVRLSHILSLSYIPEIPLLNDLLDKVLEKQMTSAEIAKLSQNLMKNPLESEIVEQPSLKNYLVFPLTLLLLSIVPFVSQGGDFMSVDVVLFLVPFFLILPVVLIIIWNIKMISFEIQNFRVIRKSGIFYRKQISILYSKIDHINKSSGFWNKIFKNGNVEVNTIGSSKVEMAMNNLSEFEKVYEAVKNKL